MLSFSTILVALGTLAVWVLAVRAHRLRRWRESHVALNVEFPNSLLPHATEAFIVSLAGLKLPRWKRPFGLPSIVVEIDADAEAIAHRLLVPSFALSYVRSQLRLAIPGARVNEGRRPDVVVHLAGELAAPKPQHTLRVDQPEGIAAALLGTLRPLQSRERAIVQWVLAPASTPAPAPSSWDPREAASPRWRACTRRSRPPRGAACSTSRSTR